MAQTQNSPGVWRPPTPPPMPHPLYVTYNQAPYPRNQPSYPPNQPPYPPNQPPYPPRSSPYSTPSSQGRALQQIIIQEDNDNRTFNGNSAVILIQSMLIIFSVAALILEIVVLVYSLRIFQYCAPSKVCSHNTLFIFQVIIACMSFFPIMMGCVSSLIKNLYILAGYAIFVIIFGIVQLIIGLYCQSIATDEFLEPDENYVWIQTTLVIIYAVLLSLLEIGGATLALLLAFLVHG